MKDNEEEFWAEFEYCSTGITDESVWRGFHDICRRAGYAPTGCRCLACWTFRPLWMLRYPWIE